MLILTRKLGEQIQIGEDILVTVVRINNQVVRLGIDASRDSSIERKELMSSKQEDADSSSSESKPQQSLED